MNATRTATGAHDVGLMAADFPPSEFGRGDIAHLAYLNWCADGRPSGHDMRYWLEAESQLKATWHLLVVASAAGAAAEALEQQALHTLSLGETKRRFRKSARKAGSVNR